uniref:Secreted protein n=1 Tax=Xenopus tropicalis TaxID=8364 RepID=A0A310T8Y3_XENTR
MNGFSLQILLFLLYSPPYTLPGTSHSLDLCLIPFPLSVFRGFLSRSVPSSCSAVIPPPRCTSLILCCCHLPATLLLHPHPSQSPPNLPSSQ